MSRRLFYGLALLAFGAAAGAFLSTRSDRKPSPQLTDEVVRAHSQRARDAGDGGLAVARADGELQRRVDQLSAKLAQESGERRRLEERIDQLAAQLAERGAAEAQQSSAAASAPAPAADNGKAAAAEPATSDGGPTPIERALVAAGVDSRTAADIKRRRDELTLSEMYLRDEASRDQWLDSPRFKEEMADIDRQRVSIRDEIGDDSYDRYLAALGEPNRVTVDEVLTDSPAALAGLQAGDMVLRYGDMRIFAPNELVDETHTGTAGENVRLQILRQGQVLEVDVPRGPLGLRIAAGRSDPGGG